MKIDTSDFVAGAAVVVAAIGFYFVGRYHEDYLKEKEANQENQVNPEAPVEEPEVTD